MRPGWIGTALESLAPVSTVRLGATGSYQPAASSPASAAWIAGLA